VKLALGTAQFGLPYGVANVNGQVSEEAARQMLEYARGAGVNTLDTAIAYGDSEQCLGNIGVDGWIVVTKLPAVPDDCHKVEEWVNEQFRQSLARLGVKRVAGLMLHRPGQLLESRGQELWSAMRSLKLEKLVEKIGFSIYEPAELDLLCGDFQPNIVQAPYNILDHRPKASGWLDKLHNEGVEVHVRSVFLQGLLLMSRTERLSKFSKWREVWDQWDQWLMESKLAPVEACLGFIASESAIDYAVVGADTLRQFKQIVGYASSANKITAPETLSVDDAGLINPVNW
jgi:aryl-alcohol dehydrogenase-like predicted oxidoreductase